MLLVQRRHGRAIGEAILGMDKSVQGHWAGMLAQRIAEINARHPNLMGKQCAQAPGVPIIQYQRGVLEASAMRFPNGMEPCVPRLVWLQMQVGTPRRCCWNRPFPPVGPMVRGWRIRAMGPGNAATDDIDSGILGVGDVRIDLQGELRHSFNEQWQIALQMLATFGCMVRTTTLLKRGHGAHWQVGGGCWPWHSSRP